jgi:hypothetical protein
MSAGVRKILLMGLAAILLACWPALAALTTVSGLFQAGKYEDAREAVRAGDEGARPGEEILWRSRLATDPKEAISRLESGLGDKKYPAAVRIRMALEVAEIQAGLLHCRCRRLRGHLRIARPETIRPPY